MFKKYGLNIGAAILAVVAVFITTFSSVQSVKAAPRYTDFYWRLDVPGAPLQASSYTAIDADTYSDISCPAGSAKACKLRSSAASLPSTMTDADNNSIPDVTGVVVDVPRRN